MPKKKSNNEELVEEMIEQFPSNSRASKVAPLRETRAQPILEEGANIEEVEETRRSPRGFRRKKTLAQSVANTVFGDATKGIAQHVLYDVLLPAAKDTISDMVKTFMDMLIFGDARPTSRRDRDKGKTIVSYGSYYKNRDEERRSPRTSRDRFGLEDIFFGTPKEANDVLSELCDQLEEYEWVTVATYLELAGIDDIPWVADKWGWNDLKRARCVHTRGGYAVVLPPEKEVD